MSVLLPSTDAAVFVQVGVVGIIGLILLILALRRGATNAAWFIGGLLVFSIGFFVLRASH